MSRSWRGSSTAIRLGTRSSTSACSTSTGPWPRESPVPAKAPRPSPVALFVLLSGSLLSMIDSSVVNVAVPDISKQLGAPLTTVQWPVSGYLLALAATLPASAYLGRRFGTVRMYAWSLAAFTLTSALCAVAQTAPELIAGRALQGIAA